MEKFLVMGLLVIVVFLVGCSIFQWLWNGTMPDQFGLKPLRYRVAFHLLLIAAFLFSGGLFTMNLTPPPSETVTAVLSP